MSEDEIETSLLEGITRPVRLGQGAVLNGRYRLDAELGRGGMGVVYRGTDLQLDREVAVKMLPEAAASDNGGAACCRKPAAAALNHPHIVAMHDVGEDGGIPFLVMELVPGTPLRRERIEDAREIVMLGAQVCDALAHAHAHGIVHRDIKPENIHRGQ